MPPPRRKTTAANVNANAGAGSSASRPTRSSRGRDEESPDPIALTPFPRTRRRTRLLTSPTASHSSARSSSIPLPTSTQAQAQAAARSSSPALGKLPTSRLRSGRRSKGYVPIELGSQDLVVPSDEEEFELWAEGKKGESSRMAQERYERQRSRSHSIEHGVSQLGDLRGSQRELS